jgi:hypothetical protein
MTQGFHSFYMGLHGPHCHESMLGLHYDSYATPNINDPTLELLLALVRVSLLEETEISDTEEVALTDEGMFSLLFFLTYILKLCNKTF